MQSLNHLLIRNRIIFTHELKPGDGSLIKTKSASSTKADYIGVKTLNGSTYFRNDFAIGTHTFKHKGYKTVNGQTKAYW